MIGELTEIPFGLKGKVFRSPMPFAVYDRNHDLVEQYKQQEIQTVVMLTSSQEAQYRTGLNLNDVYEDHGFQVLQLPIIDFDIPKAGQLLALLNRMHQEALEGRPLVVHCFAGIGRAGVVLSCLARKVFGFEGEEAIVWLRQYVPEAVQTMDQVRFVKEIAFED